MATVPDVHSVVLIKQLRGLLKGEGAHLPLGVVAANFPYELQGVIPAELPYSAWQLLEHLRIAQRDILEFAHPPEGGYKPLQWPDEYWRQAAAPPAETSWEEALDAISTDRQAFESLLTASNADLYAPFHWGDGQNLLHEALLVADHTSYHTGELLLLRRLLGAWPAK